MCHCNVAMKIGIQISLQDSAFNSFGYIVRSSIAGSYDNSFVFNYLGTAILFFVVTASFCILTNSAQGFQFLHLLANTC